MVDRRGGLGLVKRSTRKREGVAVPRGRAGDAPSLPSRLPNDPLVLDVAIQHDC
jgi:hypothetical protein